MQNKNIKKLIVLDLIASSLIEWRLTYKDAMSKLTTDTEKLEITSLNV